MKASFFSTKGNSSMSLDFIVLPPNMSILHT
jgi:hypothetical protein